MISRAKINPKRRWARIHAEFVNGYEDTLPLEIKNRYEKWKMDLFHLHGINCDMQVKNLIFPQHSFL